MSTELAADICAAALLAYLAWRLTFTVVSWVRRFLPRDPQRRYSPTQRRQLLIRSGYRCEHHYFHVLRCRERHLLEADHVIPWSRGGRTTLENGQMLCRRHNRRKTNRYPSPLYRWMVRRRQTPLSTVSSPPRVRSSRSTTRARPTGSRPVSRSSRMRSRS
jgi:hypothetical protein